MKSATVLVVGAVLATGLAGCSSTDSATSTPNSGNASATGPATVGTAGETTGPTTRGTTGGATAATTLPTVGSERNRTP